MIAAALIAAAASRAPAQTLPESAVGGTPYVIANGGFDAGDDSGHPIAWSVTGAADGAKIVNRKADRTAGLGSLELKTKPDALLAVRSRRVIAVAGGAYTLNAKVKLLTGAPASLAVEFWDFNNKLLSESHVTPPAGTGWQDVKLDATAPAEAVHAVIVLQSDKAAAGTSVWDEINLQLAPPAYEPKLGSTRELFLDDYRIESASHVKRVVHPAITTAAPVLRADKPWEDSAYIYGSAFKIGDTYRMWYTAYNDVAPNYHMAYAESRDGLNWTKANLGLVDYKGSKENNLTPAAGTIAYNPDAPPERRYTSMGFQPGTPNKTLGYYVWFSPDGMAWTRASDKPALFDGDVSNIAYDPVGKQYIATIKKRMFTARTPGTYERAAFVSTSVDAITWTSPRLAVEGDYADDGAAEAIGGIEAQIYGMPVARYESTYVGFPWVFSILDFTEGESAAAGEGPIDVQLASSRDLAHWSRPVRAPVIAPGAPGAWDAGTHYTASNILVEDDRILMYYAAFNNGHGGGDTKDPRRGKNIGHSGLATWRRDGWVSISNVSTEGLGEAGQVVTKPIVLDGHTLHVNALVRDKGSVKVEVLADDGSAIAGYTAADAVPITGDQLKATISWAGGKSISDLSKKTIKLRFLVANADLYSYWVD